MIRAVLAAAAVLLLVTALVTAQEQIPASLRAMADTELEFAAAARVKGIRDSFLEFFTDDSIAFNPQPIKAKERLASRPSQPFSAQELTWEPRTGDVAASGDLGWLTGPSTFINHAGEDKTPRHGNYLSVWRKLPDGKWRVFIDVGSDLPAAAPFPPGFQRFAFGDRYAGAEGKDKATASLRAADVEMNQRIGTGGGAALVERMKPTTRLHRHGTLPLIGPDAIAEWLKQNAAAIRATTGAAEAAASGDFGYSYGTFEVTAPKPQTGAYVRLWTRDRAGRWFVVVDAVA